MVRALTSLVGYKLGIRSAHTSVTFAERACLARHAAGKKRLVEIGVWQGATTRLLRSVMHPEGIYYAVDPYPRMGWFPVSVAKIIAEDETSKAPNGTLQWMRMTGVEAARALRSRGEPEVDFIFIDGDHSFDGLRGDWESWSTLLAPGAIVALHDSLPPADNPALDWGAAKYTREIIHPDRRFTRIDAVHSLSVYQRIVS